MLVARMPRVRTEELQHYARLIEQLLPAAPLAPEPPEPGAILVERGAAFPQCLRIAAVADREKAAAPLLDLPPPQGDIRVVDAASHTRPAYMGLLAYCWMRTYLLARGSSLESAERWQQTARAWCDRMREEVSQLDWPIGGLPASRGADVTGAAWCAVALHAGTAALPQQRWSQIGAETLGRLAAAQRGSGAFLVAGASDNPETLWYHELVLLHATASYAAQSNDPLATAAVMQAADFHLRETQPDHATTQPWGLLAFIWRREARSVADAMLHALQIQQPGQRSGITSILLADCLYCLRLLARQGAAGP